MNDSVPFTQPEVTDEDIRWACGLLNLKANAFHGDKGDDPRQVVLKSMEPMDVAACPGSGKTTLLVAKLAILAEKWHDQTRGVCVLSHTNAARQEIETKLGGTTAGRRLLSYPHFIGTIHGFVNEFLAKPWLRSRGYPIKIIDTEICERRRWRKLNPGTRAYLERNGADESNIRIIDANFRLAKKNGAFPCGEQKPTYQQVQSACKAATGEGYHCFDDMFIWAGEMMDRMPSVILLIRERFPLLFIDEAQDNNEDQSAILYRVFMDEGRPVIRQRFGDANQAIFDFVGAKGEETDDAFPNERATELPNSHRFGQRIADLASPLALDSCGLKGEGPKQWGPKTPLRSSQQEAEHTIFLFEDENITKVLDAFGELLLRTFSEETLSEGSKKGMFVAVGQVHKDKGDVHKPCHLAHYWPDYDPELTQSDPKPQTFVEYVFAGMAAAERVGQSYPAVEKIAEGILRLAAMAEGGRTLHDGRYRHRHVMHLLEADANARRNYVKVLDAFAVRRESPAKDVWNLGRRPDIVKGIAESIATVPLSGDEVRAFLKWPEEPACPTNSSVTRQNRDNIYQYPSDNPKVHIRVGSIHSIKGQTHAATLVLETFWQDHNLHKLKPWIVRPNMERGWNKPNGVEQKKRLKIHYVAMTRPTHLLCLAMKRASFEKDGGLLDQEALEKLKERGWRIQCVGAR